MLLRRNITTPCRQHAPAKERRRARTQEAESQWLLVSTIGPLFMSSCATDRTIQGRVSRVKLNGEPFPVSSGLDMR